MKKNPDKGKKYLSPSPIFTQHNAFWPHPSNRPTTPPEPTTFLLIEYGELLRCMWCSDKHRSSQWTYMLKSMLSEAHFISTAHLILPTIRMGVNSITYGKWRGVGEQSAQFSWNRGERRFIFALCWSRALTG